MDLQKVLTDLVTYTLAGIGTIYVAFYLVKPYLDKAEKIHLVELKKTIANQTLPLRFQAYERLVLFIERVNPANMLLRLHGTSYSARELHSLIMTEIREEFQHNVTQQIYVSDRTWEVVKRVKDDTISVVTNAVKALPETATGLELSKTVLAHMASLQDNPYDIATQMLRSDMEGLF